MKNRFIYFLFAAFAMIACEEDDIQDEVDAIAAPQNVDLTFKITQDNTGLVTITPTAQGATTFEVFYGDGNEEDSAQLALGESTQYTYDEGNYQVRVIATGVNGKQTEVTKDLMVSFRAPENLEIEVTPDPSNSFAVDVSASADFATMFEVTFGEDDDEEPQELALDGVASYEYESTGIYEITVTAFSGGEATTTQTIEVEIVDPVLLPIDFESDTIEYTFGDFGGAASAKVDNPDNDGNESENVAQTIKTDGAETFAGTVIELGAPIDFSTFEKIKMKVRSPRPNTFVTLKLENATNSDIAAEVSAVTSGDTDEWETLLFDFGDADLTQEYSKLIIFFDLGNTGDGTTYFFDDIEQTNQQAELLRLPLTFESPVIEYNFIEFGGAPTTVVDNPQTTGINISPIVATTLKVNGAQSFAGAFIDLEQAINFDDFSQIQVDVLSPKAGSVVNLKVENLDDASRNREVTAVTSATPGEWETLTFDFTGIDTSVDYQRVIIFFDFLTDGQGDRYYFDNIRESDGSNPLDLPLSFEDSSQSYSFVDFGGASTSIASNPDADDVNSSDTVARSVKSASAEFFAGSFITLSDPIDFQSQTKIRMKTYAPVSGITIKLKLENESNPDISTEIDVTNTVANQWEELVYDFSAQDLSREYSKVVVFFDFGNGGIGQDLEYYFDEIILSN
ncbi:phage tail protein [Nonlabens ponticola]|uniref:PKD/Chitinase domain-containing protein n=1 Tax=Nonlabens ponticola TaxID=2496866 RepID=A0A3S9N0G7_9FLAO|nr:hypothetical protein [Nonlabens ponticola]AZQ44907.1 hypothetical protein EJ995_11980 [Nonlabens ponticola]